MFAFARSRRTRATVIGIILVIFGIVIGTGAASAATGGTAYPVGPGQIVVNGDPNNLVLAAEVADYGVSADWLHNTEDQQGGGIAAWNPVWVYGVGIDFAGHMFIINTPHPRG